jgi:hypothetical protein
MRLLGAQRQPQVVGLDELEGKSNYFIGSDPTKWRTAVPSYRKVRYGDVYSGIDLIYYGNRNQLEYDLVVRPGSYVQTIRLGFAGACKLQIDSNGDLVLGLREGEVRQQKPVAYQEVDGRIQEISSRYILFGDNQVGFEVGSYDESKPLVIDPVLSFSTYLGGTAEDRGYSITVDASGAAYVTGVTASANFPVSNAMQAYLGSEDAFVTKLSATGTSLVYSTYLGGTGTDVGWDIVADSAGAAYVTGSTTSANFPTTGGAFDVTCGTDGNCNPNGSGVKAADVFVSKLSNTGSLSYSTFVGGSRVETGIGIATNSITGAVYITGHTESTDFTTTSGAFDRQCGTDSNCNPISSTDNADDVFILQLSSNLSALVYSSYLGGSGSEYGYDIAVDSAGNAYVTGFTDSGTFPTLNAYQPSLSSGGRRSKIYPDAFITKLNPSGSALVYSTYLGGTDKDYAEGIAIDGYGYAYVVGYTLSANFPVANAYQPFYAGAGTTYDAFVAKLCTGGNTLVYSTYLGKSQDEYGVAIAVDSSGNAHVAGHTSSQDFPLVNTLQAIGGGYPDIFVTKFDSTGGALLYSTFIGGSDDYNTASGLALDSSGNAYVTGFSLSAKFPVANAFQPQNAGGACGFFYCADVVVFKISNITGHNITGQLNDTNGVPISGVTVKMTGSQTTETVSNTNGNYTFPNLVPGGSYTISPSSTTYTFVPTSQTFTNLSASQAFNFTATTAAPLTLIAIADAYVQDGASANTNYGSVTPLLAQTSNKSGQNRDIYLKFDLGSVTGTINSAKLRIYAALSKAGSVGTTTYSVSNTSWIETGAGSVTWNNKPARSAGAISGTVTVNSTSYNTYDLDVTSYVVSEKAQGRNVVSLCLHNTSSSSIYIKIFSKESASNKPQLYVVTQ